jgi:hypothetical protein
MKRLTGILTPTRGSPAAGATGFSATASHGIALDQQLPIWVNAIV